MWLPASAANDAVFPESPTGRLLQKRETEVTNALPMPSGNAVAEVFQWAP
jgi:hypothetical protein